MKSMPGARRLGPSFLSYLLWSAQLYSACGGGEDDDTRPPAACGDNGCGHDVYGYRDGCASPAPAGSARISDTEILLGSEAILSGTMGAVYATIPKTVSAYFDYINDTEGGVCGRTIVYRVEDNKDDPAVALEVARKLVEQDKVFAMVGSLGDGPHPASWEYLNEKGVPDILASAGGHRFGADPQGHPWTVQMIPSYTIEGKFYGYISESYGHEGSCPAGQQRRRLMAEAEARSRPNKNEIVAEEVFDTAISISSQVTNMKKTNAEVGVLFSSPGFTAQAIKAADRLGWHPHWFMSYINSDDMMFSFVSPALGGLITFQALVAAWAGRPRSPGITTLKVRCPAQQLHHHAQTMAETA
jgi:ABC-type branched-subunit amino acid transport system substrate-binding protein